MKRVVGFLPFHLLVHPLVRYIGSSKCQALRWHWLSPLGSRSHSPGREADTQILGFVGTPEEGKTHCARRAASWRR